MPEAVIVATSRSPIGRANKGSLVSIRPDDMAAQIVKDLLSKAPAVDPNSVEDLMIGTAQPAGAQGFNLGRAVAILAGLQVPGVTVNRYCSSSLQTIRMAAHAIKAGEGDIFIAAGVESVSNFSSGVADTPAALAENTADAYAPPYPSVSPSVADTASCSGADSPLTPWYTWHRCVSQISPLAAIARSA